MGEDMSKILALLKVNNHTNRHVQDVVGGCGGVFFFFPLLLFVVAVDLASGQWRRWWVDVVASGARLRKRERKKKN